MCKMPQFFNSILLSNVSAAAVSCPQAGITVNWNLKSMKHWSEVECWMLLLLLGIFSIWLVNNHFRAVQGNKQFNQASPALITSYKHSLHPWKLHSVSCIIYYLSSRLIEAYKLLLPAVYSAFLTPESHLSSSLSDLQGVTNSAVSQSSWSADGPELCTSGWTRRDEIESC